MNEERFVKWARDKKEISVLTIKKYVGAIGSVERDLLEEGIETSILNIDKAGEVQKILKRYLAINKFYEKNQRGKRMYSSALKKYIEYLEDDYEGNSEMKDDIQINKIEEYIRGKGYTYKNDMIMNFYLSLKSKPFVILAGISGTGKSKLVELFAEAIGAGENYNIISVKPDWTDGTELLGYKNIKDEFVPGLLTEIIADASLEENKDKPYFVCLDEMNLARVEYYLGEYLSLIESRYRNDRDEIVTREIFKKGYFKEGDRYEGLYFPENSYIVGTVNMDDTTFGFSKKVLDRANTIEFSDADLSDLDFLDSIGEEECVSLSCNNEFMKTNFLGIKDIWNADIDGISSEELKEYVRSVNGRIVEIQEILKEYSRHFAFRVRDEIIIYMTENKISNLLEEDIAFDYQFMQKILPIISGGDEGTRKILIKLLELCIGEEVEELENYSVEEIEEQIKTFKIKYKLSAKKNCTDDKRI